jgi:hypothetical protein
VKSLQHANETATPKGIMTETTVHHEETIQGHDLHVENVQEALKDVRALQDVRGVVKGCMDDLLVHRIWIHMRIGIAQVMTRIGLERRLENKARIIGLEYRLQEQVLQTRIPVDTLLREVAGRRVLVVMTILKSTSSFNLFGPFRMLMSFLGDGKGEKL